MYINIYNYKFKDATLSVKMDSLHQGRVADNSILVRIFEVELWKI